MTSTERARRVDELLEFVAACPTRPLDRQSAGWVIDQIGLDKDNLLELGGGRRRFLVGALFVEMDNPAAAAELLVLGYRPSVGTAAELDDGVAWAEERARQFGARGLEVSVPAVLAPLEPVLRGRRYRLAYRLLFMHLADLATSPLVDLEPPPPLAWRTLNEDHLEAAHHCYRRAFAATSGAQIPDLDLFRATMLKAEHRPRLLMKGDRAVALTRVAWHDEAARRGEVRWVARDPSFARAGLGSAALAEGVRSLVALGATSACLEVASDNQAAVGLYAKFGFRTEEVAQVFRRDL